MKLTLLLLWLQGVDVDHAIEMQSAKIHFEEHLASTPEEINP